MVVTTQNGRGVCQFWYETPRKISVDHRRDLVGYWVADVVFRDLHAVSPGTLREDALPNKTDLTGPVPATFVDYAGPVSPDLYKPYFTGDLQKFWGPSSP